MLRDFAERNDSCSILREFEIVKNSGEENYVVKRVGSSVRLKKQKHSRSVFEHVLAANYFVLLLEIGLERSERNLLFLLLELETLESLRGS